jgi:predicted dehydrogenase
MGRKVKIIGAGSIGNHLANASRFLGWEVVICDLDLKALERTRTEIYPSRYGKWDEAIQLYPAAEAPRGGFDLICIGTPPDVHVPLAIAAAQEKPRLILIEKPVCGPRLEKVPELVRTLAENGVQACVGYDHVLAKSLGRVEELIAAGVVGEPVTIDAEFREHWGGIFKAHPWLSGPWESYLGYWQRGGGSGGEHSHATNLWQHLAHCCGAGRVNWVSALVEFKKEREAEYDSIFALHVKTETGFYGRIVQDVVTMPPRKWAKIQGTKGAIEWHANQGARGDVVRWVRADGTTEEYDFPKTRPDDFIQEMNHLEEVMAGRMKESPTSLTRGLETMLVVAAAYESGRQQRPYRINYQTGLAYESITPA